LLSLSALCGIYYCDRIKECILVNILLLDFLKLNREIARLEAQEEALEAQIEKDRDAADTAQATILALIVKA
jgi:cell division protein FtsB